MATKRPASLPLPTYGLKQGDMSKKAWQSARAREAGYKSYADWLNTRRKEGVKKTNLGRASETYKEKVRTGKVTKNYSRRESLRTQTGKTLGDSYYFNIQKNGWSGLIAFIDGLDSQTNVMVIVKTNRGRILTLPPGRVAVGKFQKYDNFGAFAQEVVDKQSPDKKKEKKGKKRKPEVIVEVIVHVLGESKVSRYK